MARWFGISKPCGKPEVIKGFRGYTKHNEEILEYMNNCGHECGMT
jgi:hypothetical protein